MKPAIAAFLALAAALTAGTAPAQTLDRGNGADPATLDPHRALAATEANILRDLYEGLVSYDAAGNIIPGVAGSWTISDDRLTYTFDLRPASWSNGTPVTAEDFVGSLRRLIDPETAAPDAGLFGAIRGAGAILAGDADPPTLGVAAADAFTLVIELERPEPMLLHLLARPSALPLHRNFRTVEAIPSATRPFNGAYRLDRFEPGVGLWLLKNERYHAAGGVAFEAVIYRGYDRLRALAAYAEGEIQISSDLPLFAIAELADEYGDALRAAPYAGAVFLAADLGGALADPALRLAIALAIDRVRLSGETWMGAMIPTLSVIPPGLADNTGAAVAALGSNDPERRRADARALLAAAGFGADNPLELTLAISAGVLQQQTAAAIADDLAAVGVAATILERPSSEHRQRLLAGRDFDLATVGWIGPVGHVAEFLALFESGDLDITGYRDPAFESLIAEAEITADATVRAALFAAADRRLMRALPAIPLMHYASFNLVSPAIAGWEDNPTDVHLSRWLRPAEIAE